MGCGSSSAADPKEAGAGGDFDDESNRTATKNGRKTDGEDEAFFEVAEDAEGQEFMASKPWIGQVAEPDNHAEPNKDAPDVNYELEYVYGYRSADSRQNVYFNCEKQATYMTAAVGVILDHENNTQKFFGGGLTDDSRRKTQGEQDCHNDDIMALAISPDRKFAVTGQRGSVPLIFTWDAITGAKQARSVMAKGSGGIQCVSISSDCKQFAAVDMSNDHNVYVFDAATGTQKHKQKGDTNKIYDICFSGAPGSYVLCTTGSKHVKFWDFNASKQEHRGIYGPDNRDVSSMSHCVCASDAEGTFYTGAQSGQIYIWKDNNLAKRVDAHKGGYISSIRCIDYMLFTGGKDGNVMIWDCPTLDAKKTIQCGSMIRAIDHLDGNLLVGTRDGCISYVNMESEEKRSIMESHNDGEVWGLADKDENCIITSGDDNQVIIWNHETRKCEKKHGVSSRSAKAKKGGASSITTKPASQCSRAVAIGPNQETIVAANDGVVHVHMADGTTSKKLEEAQEWIEVMSVSPCGKFLAVGSHDNKIRLYDTATYTCCGTGNKHSSAIQTMDWSVDSTYLRSTCQAYELLFWKIAEDGSLEQDASGRSNTTSVTFASKTVKFGWHVDGIFPRGTDGSHINSVSGNKAGDLIVTGDDWCNVRIFRDPCRKGGKCKTYRGHSEFVTNCFFKGNRIFSVGGYDQTLMQWKEC